MPYSLNCMIFSDHAAGSICDVELVTDQRIYTVVVSWWGLVVNKIEKRFV